MNVTSASRLLNRCLTGGARFAWHHARPCASQTASSDPNGTGLQEPGATQLPLEAVPQKEDQFSHGPHVGATLDRARVGNVRPLSLVPNLNLSAWERNCAHSRSVSTASARRLESDVGCRRRWKLASLLVLEKLKSQIVARKKAQELRSHGDLSRELSLK